MALPAIIEDNKGKILLGVVALFFVGRWVRRSLSTSDTSLRVCGKDLKNTTYPEQMYNQLADQFEVAVWNSFDGITENDAAMFNILQQMRTDDDLAALICVYGERVRQSSINDVLNEPMNLIDTTTAYLDTPYKIALNRIYDGRGMISKIY